VEIYFFVAKFGKTTENTEIINRKKNSASLRIIQAPEMKMMFVGIIEIFERHHEI